MNPPSYLHRSTQPDLRRLMTGASAADCTVHFRESEVVRERSSIVDQGTLVTGTGHEEDSSHRMGGGILGS